MATKIRMRKCETCRKLKTLTKFNSRDRICKTCTNKNKKENRKLYNKKIPERKIYHKKEDIVPCNIDSLINFIDIVAQFENKPKTKTIPIPRSQAVEICRQTKNQIKSIGCQLCGYDRCIPALEFHHIDKSTKIPNAINLLSKYYDEIRKCIVLCSNCHREIEHGIIQVSDADLEESRQIIEAILDGKIKPENLKKQGV